MFRCNIPLLFATGLLATGTAHAADVTVRVAGRTDVQIRHDVEVAANRVCTAATAADPLLLLDDCVQDTVDVTLQTIAASDGYRVAAR